MADVRLEAVGVAPMRSDNVIGIPESSDAFEDRCAVLFRRVVNDPGLKGVATSGANQEGIDLIGARDGDPHQPISVQCKLKKRQDRLGMAEARSDIERSLRIQPPLTEIYVVTTAPDELALDKLAIAIRQQQAELGRAVQIHVWGWNELQRRIRQFPDAIQAFDPEFSATAEELLRFGHESVEIGRKTATELAAVRSEQQVVAGGVEQILALMRSADTGSGALLDKVFDQQIDSFRDLLNRGRPGTAAEMLADLESRLPETASSAVRSRIRANLGFARMREGRDEEASRFLRDAYELNSSDRKARAHLNLALILEGRFDEAMTGCRILLGEDPTDALAASFAYQAAAMHDGSVNPDTFVAAELRTDENVAINRLNVLRRRDDGTWMAAAADLLAEYPDSGVAKRFAAEAMLEQAFAARSYDLPSEQGRERRAGIERAAELLQEHWDQVRLYENASQDVWAGVGVNLVTTYRSLRRREDARRVSDQLLAIAPEMSDARVAAAHLDIIDDTPTKAIERVRTMPEGGSRTMVMLAALAGTADWAAVIAFATPDRRSEVRDEDVRFLDMLVARARIETGVSDVETALREVVDVWPGDDTVLAGAAQAARIRDPALAKELLHRLLSGFTLETSFSVRVMAAEVAIDLNSPDEIIAALDGFVDTETMSEPLTWLAWAYASAPVTPRTRVFFETLSEHVLAEPRIARRAGIAANSRGDIDGAERHLLRALASDPRDLRARMILHGAYMRSDKPDAANELVREVDEREAGGSPRDRMRLALMLRQAGEEMRAFELAYGVTSTNRADEHVVQMYPGMFFATGHVPPDIRTVGPAHIGDWFELEEVDGGKAVSGLIQNETTPEVVSYPPEQPLAQQVLGTSAGDEIVVPQGIGEPRRYRVKEVKHRFVWLLHDIIHTQATRFPQSRSMGSMTMREGDVQPMLDMVRRHHRQGLDICRTYRELAVPLEALAAITRVSVLQIAELIPQEGGQIRTCLGDDDEREAAERACARARDRGAVLDTLTAWSAYHLGLLEPMREFFGTLAVPQTTIDELLEMRAKEELHVGREYMTIGYDGDQAIRQVHSPEDTQRRITMFSETLAALRANCEVLPVEGSEDPELARLLHREVVESILDPLLVAKQTGRLLLSEDLHLRQLARSQGFADGAWLQTAARSMLAADVIDWATYALCVARLASRRHGHVSLDGDVLIAMLRHEHAQVLLDAAANYIGGPRAEIISHAYVVADFMNKAWSSGVPSWQAGGAASLLITRLISKRDEWWETLELLMQMFGRIARPGSRPDLSRAYLRDWMRGHFLSRPDPIRRRASRTPKSTRRQM